MRLLVTGGSGALGRALVPLAAAAGHQPVLPTHDELDLFDVCGDGERVSNRRCSQAVGWHPDR
jgi:dTDP-4-dehydrorhamnose reductase